MFKLQWKRRPIQNGTTKEEVSFPPLNLPAYHNQYKVPVCHCSQPSTFSIQSAAVEAQQCKYKTARFQSHVSTEVWFLANKY